ncbi:MAG: adenylate/guanylate cyclase domain-containing protein [Rhodoferax sp.]|nr:adenylate/guanylate cyclase domain-containing protein [Rhodoferax sp.]
MSHALYVLLRTALSLALVVLLLLHVSGDLPLPLLNRLEQLAYDARLRMTMPGGVETRIVIVDLDEASLQREGPWPWPRQQVAQLVDTLFDQYQVGVLGFDVLFDKSPRDLTLQAVDQLALGPLRDNAQFQQHWTTVRAQTDGDAAFAASLRGRPIVIGYYFTSEAQPDAHMQFGQLPAPAATLQQLGRAANPFGSVTGYGANLAALQAGARSGGFFSSDLVDDDGLFRRLPLLKTYNNQLYEQLGLAVVRTLLGQPPLEFVSAAGYAAAGSSGGQQVESVRVGTIEIPVDDQGASLLPYLGPQGSFPYVSASHVLRRTADPKLLKGAIVLLGSTAPGLMDLRATPVQNIYPGVEINATLIAGVLDGRIKDRTGYTVGLEVALLVLIGVLSTGLGWLPPLRALLATLTLAVAVIGFNLFVWQVHNHVIPLAPSLVLILLLYLMHSSYGYFVQNRREQRLAQVFGQYVPPDLVAEMSKKPANFALGGESREMTVLFSDLADFTSVSEGLTPQQLTQLMQFVLTPLTQVIHSQRGTVDKYIGDAIMAFWGAPLADADHARHAVLAALAMKARLAALQPELQVHGWPPLRMRIGVNTGAMNVGNMGSEFRMAYTVLGDAVNLASRLEGAAKQYRATIVISETTRAAVPEIVCRELDRVRVKGRAQPVTLFEPLALLGDLDAQRQQELAEYARALALFRAKQWPSAQLAFATLIQAWPQEHLYSLYLARIDALQCDPPGPEWDGVCNLTEK